MPCDSDGDTRRYDDDYDEIDDPDIPIACDMFVACADGTAEQACSQTFAPLCTGHGGVIGDPFNRYQEQEEREVIYVRCNDGSFDTSRNGVKPCLTRGGEVEEFDTRTDAQREADLAEIRAGWEGGSESGGDGDRPVSQGGMIPDNVYYGVAMSNEMPIDELPIAVAAPALPIGQTPSTNFDTPVRSLTPLPFERTTSTTETPTTETPTTEEPKQGVLGILAIGLIALKVLAT